MITTDLQKRRGTLASKPFRCTLALVALSIVGAAGAQEIRTTVDSVLVNFPDVQPLMINGRVMVPARGVFEHMNASVDWDSNTRIVTAQRGSDTITLPINAFSATVNGRQVNLDAPAIVRGGRTLVPLRFLSESLGSSVEWIASTRTVEINTTYASTSPSTTKPTKLGYTTMHMDRGTVIPFSLNQKLSSNGSKVGDKFTANVETGDDNEYQGMAEGSVLEGHVDVARAKTGDTPGVLGLAFDRVRMPNGQTQKVYGSLIGLDSKSVTNEDGRLTAKAGAKKNDLKYVGYGAGAGALVSILTKGNLITNTLIGGALGFLFGEIQKDPSKATNVTLESGSKFGARLTRDLNVRMMTSPKG